MRTYDFSPLYRSFVGFDRMASLIDSASQLEGTSSYPPYNVAQIDEDTYRIELAVAGFAEAEMAAIDSAAPEATDLKPYVGVQFAAIPEFPEVGSAVAQEIAAALSGAKSVDDALAASQAAADSIMKEAGYYD